MIDPTHSLTFTYPLTGHFNVDITVNGKDGVPTIALVKQYLKTMPALKPLVLLIKALLEQHGLHSAQTSGLSSYCVICMVISFLQVCFHQHSPVITPPLLPRLAEDVLADWCIVLCCVIYR